MKQIITLLVAAGMTLAAFAQTPSTVGVALHPRTSRVVGDGTNLFAANADRAVATIDTVARLATLTNAYHGAVVDVRGYSTEFDWSGPLRYTLNTNSTSDTNRFSIANAGGAGRWEHDWNLSIKAFGAACDGIADDGPAIDSAWAASRRFGYKLYFPRGTNRIVLNASRTNYLGEPVGFSLWVTNANDGAREIRPTIIGEGAWNTTIALEGDGTGISIHGLSGTDIIGLGSSFVRGLKIRGIRILGDGVSNQRGIDIKLGTFDAQIEDVVLQRLGNQLSRPAMSLDRAWNLRAQNVWLDTAGWGNYGIDNFEANQQDWSSFIAVGEVGDQTVGWAMRVSGGEKSKYDLNIGTKGRYGFVAEQISGTGGNVNSLKLQSEGPATGLVFDRKAAQSYSSLTNDGLTGYLTSENHRQLAGGYVTISGVTPNEYNGTRYVLAVITTNQFTVALGVDPGGPGSGGTWQSDAWCENWDVQFYGWSYAGSIHNTLTNIDRPLIDIRRGKNITIRDSSVGTLHYRTATATNLSLVFMTNTVPPNVGFPFVKAQFASHPFADGDVVSARFLTNEIDYGLNIPGKATNVTATDVYWPVPGLTVTTNFTTTTNLLGSDGGTSSLITAPNFPIKIGPESYYVRLKDITHNNSPSDWSVWDDQPMPTRSDTRILPWLTQTPPVVFSTNWIGQATGIRFARAESNPYGINFRSTFLQERIKAVQLRCRFQASYLGGATPLTNEHVTIRFASPEQNVVSQTVGTPLSPVTILQWRCADASLDQPYYQTTWIPTDRWGYFTYQVASTSPIVTNTVEIIQVGVEVE